MTGARGAEPEALSAPNILEYPYTRTLGPILSAFMTGLRDGRVMGVRATGGRVLVPPTEYDPWTGESLSELVEVAPTGTVTSWAWVPSPRPKHPLDHPFAWGLVRLDGADTSLLHVVDCGSEAAVTTGMRVSARWRRERVGEIQDIECFVPWEAP